MSKKYTIRCKEINSAMNGVFTFNNSKFEAPGLLPGEKAEVTLLYGKDKGKAVVENILEPSPYRVKPVCPAYGTCGGCKLLHTTYEYQLQLKTEVARKLLSGFGKVEDCVGVSGEPFHYRNKINATLSTDKRGKVISGLYEETTHHVVDITSCAIEDVHASQVMCTIRDFMNSHHIKPYNEDTGKGTLRHVLFRTSATGETLVVLVSGNKIFSEKNRLAEVISEKHPFVKSIVVNYNPKKTSFILGKNEEILTGTGYVTDKMCGITFRISGKSFYQINTPQAEKIYFDAINRAGITAEDKVLDAYCGIGTIASVAATLSSAKEVVGVELNAAAVADAKENAKQAGLKNVKFINEDAGDYLYAAIGADIHYSCIIMDPPRSGASERFMKAVLKMKPEKLIYISCNPVTLARDLKMLTLRDYQAVYIRPYDMFPQTGHIETVCLLSKKP
ncbi:MAG: 23S rRNA (uracil(1939)-C(5))-methyltransferase RlmD [Lachnospiraceae bacterium]